MKRIRAAGGIVINQDGELLMIYRNAKWELPKGHQEENENIETCALREVSEETGLKALTLKDFAGTTEHSYYDIYLKEEVVKETCWFKMSGDKNEQLEPLLKEDIERVEWVPVQKLKSYLNNSFDNVKEIVKNAIFLQP